MKNLLRSKGFRWGMVSMLVLVALVFSVQTTQAEIKAISPFYTWDREDGAFKNSNTELWLDPDWWIPVIHELGNDRDQYPNACPSGESSDWAGILTMGLGHTDTTGGQGFQASRNWTLVACDRDFDGDFDNQDLSVLVAPDSPYYGFTPWGGVNEYTFSVIDQDVESTCSTGNCATELLTTMFINLDSNCNGDLSDESIPDGGVCFYAEAQPPEDSAPYWEGNLQARISAGGGDKTVNHQLAGPTAVVLKDISADSSAFDLRWGAALAGLVLLGTGGLFMWVRRAKESIR